jgi:murein DD-endopeptidase MepM/ murein hydrolase activator NlpD
VTVVNAGVRFLSILACIVIGSGAGGATGAVAAPSASVHPGSVVRWPGPELVDCALADRHWLPMDGACWYPIDLDATGSLELVRRSAGGVASRTIAIGDYPYPIERLEVEEKYVAPPKAALERIEREKARVARLWTLATPRRFTLPLAAPLATLPTASRFGSRRIFNNEPRSPHGGADFSAKPGTAVFAPADGTVALAEEQYFAGNAIYIDHGDGLISMTFHLSEIGVANGADVKRGEPIGKVGATGRVTGPHLHFAVRWRGARVDPELLLGRGELVEIR